MYALRGARSRGPVHQQKSKSIIVAELGKLKERIRELSLRIAVGLGGLSHTVTLVFIRSSTLYVCVGALGALGALGVQFVAESPGLLR